MTAPLRLISVTCYGPSMKEGHSMYKAMQFNLDFETGLMMVIGKLVNVLAPLYMYSYIYY